MPRATYPTAWTPTGHGSYRELRKGYFEIRYRDETGEHTQRDDFESRAAVEDFILDKHRNRRRRAMGLPVKLGWDEALKMYEEKLSAKERVESYIDQIRKALKSLRDDADLEPDEIQDIHVERWLNRVAKRLKEKGRKGWKATTNLQRQHASSFFKWLCKGKRLNPVEAVDKWDQDEKPKRNLTVEEFTAIYALAEPWLRDLLLFLLFTGCRIGEAAKFTRSDVVNGVWIFKKRKRGVHLELPLPAIIQEIILRQRADSAGRIWRQWHAKGCYGKPITSNWFGRMIDRICEPNNLKTFRAHALRHAFGDWQDERGTDLRTIQKALGHKSIQTTQKFYADAKRKKQILAAQEGLVSEVMKACESAVKVREDAWDKGLGNIG